MASNIIRMVLKLDDKASPELKQVGKAAEKTTSKTTMLARPLSCQRDRSP